MCVQDPFLQIQSHDIIMSYPLISLQVWYCSIITSHLHAWTHVVPQQKLVLTMFPCSVEYTQLVCSTQVTRMDIPHAIYMHGFSMQCTHVDMHVYVFMALLFNVCITSSNNLLNVSNFTKCQHKYHTFTIPTIT